MSSQEEVRLPPLPSAFRFNDAGFACISAAFLDELRRLAVLSDRAARAQPARGERGAFAVYFIHPVDHDYMQREGDEQFATIIRKRATDGFTKPLYTAPPADAKGVEKTLPFSRDWLVGTFMLSDADADDIVRAMNVALAAAKGEDARDAARLDFIEREWFYRDTDNSLCFGFNETWSAGNGKAVTLREAIDAALQSDRAREDR